MQLSSAVRRPLHSAQNLTSSIVGYCSELAAIHRAQSRWYELMSRHRLKADALSEQQGKIPAIELMRGFAILLIVASHVIDMFIWNEDALLTRALRIAISNGSVLFVFIAGFLFSHLRDRFQYRRYLMRKCQVVFLPYVLVSIPAIVIFTQFLQRELVPPSFYDQPLWIQVTDFYLSGLHLSPFWFIPMLGIFYVISFMLIRLHEHQSVLAVVLLISVLVSLTVTRGNILENFAYYFSIYLFGMMTCIARRDLYRFLMNYAVWLWLIAGILLCGFYELYFTQETKGVSNYLQKLLLCFLCLGVFLVASCDASLANSNSKDAGKIASNSSHEIRSAARVIGAVFHTTNSVLKKALFILAGTSFGIFFLHSYIISAVKLAYANVFTSLPQGGVFEVLLASLSIVLVTCLLVVSIQKVFKSYSRYLIGS